MTLASFWSWAGRFESYLVENPEDRFSHDKAQISLAQLILSKDNPYAVCMPWPNYLFILYCHDLLLWDVIYVWCVSIFCYSWIIEGKHFRRHAQKMIIFKNIMTVCIQTLSFGIWGELFGQLWLPSVTIGGHLHHILQWLHYPLITNGYNYYQYWLLIEVYEYHKNKKWATSWQNQQKWHVCPGKTQISLGIRPVWSVFAVSMKKHWALNLSAQERLWSDWADAQAYLSLCWVQISLLVLSWGSWNVWIPEKLELFS